MSVTGMGRFETDIKTGAMLMVAWFGEDGEQRPTMQAIVGQARRAAGPGHPVTLVRIGSPRLSNSIFATFRREMN